jgi:hypothetical protein
MLSIIMLAIIMLNVVLLMVHTYSFVMLNNFGRSIIAEFNYTELCCAECHCVEYSYAECSYTEGCYGECHLVQYHYTERCYVECHWTKCRSAIQIPQSKCPKPTVKLRLLFAKVISITTSVVNVKKYFFVVNDNQTLACSKLYRSLLKTFSA